MYLLRDGQQTWIVLDSVSFSALSLNLYASKCFPSYFSGEGVLFLFGKFIFPSVSCIYLPSSSPCPIDHSSCYPGSLLPPPLLLLGGLFLIWQSVAQMSPAGSLWLPWPQGDTSALYSHSVPNFLRAFGIWGVFAWFPHYRVSAPRITTVSYLTCVRAQVNESDKWIGGEWIALKKCKSVLFSE